MNRNLKQQAAEEAVARYVHDRMTLGLGTGSTVYFALRKLGEELAAGRLKEIAGVPTSIHTEREATAFGIPLTNLQDHAPLDLTIDGRGFFVVTIPRRGGLGIQYTRAGNFVRNSEGNVVLGNSGGAVLDPSINIPSDEIGITVGRNGEVRIRQQGSQTLNVIGQIDLARFVNVEGLKQIGRNLYVETDSSGPPITGTPETDGLGSIAQGQLEMSNVDPVRELIDLITTQRSFELNSQSIQSADQTLQILSNLRRF